MKTSSLEYLKTLTQNLNSRDIRLQDFYENIINSIPLLICVVDNKTGDEIFSNVSFREKAKQVTSLNKIIKAHVVNKHEDFPHSFIIDENGTKMKVICDELNSNRELSKILVCLLPDCLGE